MGVCGFVRNVGTCASDYTASYARRQWSSLNGCWRNIVWRRAQKVIVRISSSYWPIIICILHEAETKQHHISQGWCIAQNLVVLPSTASKALEAELKIWIWNVNEKLCDYSCYIRLYVCTPFEDWHSSEIYKCTLSASQRTFALSIIRSNRLMLFRKIIIVWENRDFLNNTVGGRCSYVCTLDGYVTHHFAVFLPVQPCWGYRLKSTFYEFPFFSEVRIIRMFPRVSYVCIWHAD